MSPANGCVLPTDLSATWGGAGAILRSSSLPHPVLCCLSQKTRLDHPEALNRVDSFALTAEVVLGVPNTHVPIQKSRFYIGVNTFSFELLQTDRDT